MKIRKAVCFILIVMLANVTIGQIFAAEKFDSDESYGVRKFNEYIETLSIDYAKLILEDHELVEMMKMDSYWAEETSTLGIDAVTIGLPLTAYPAGSYFTINGKACSCHPNCTYEVPERYESCYIKKTNSPGNCKFYEPTGSIQCKAFADYVYKQYNGRDASNVYSISIASKFTSIGNSSAGQALMKEFFTNRTVGTNVRVNCRNADYNHSFIITSVGDSGITIYDANRDGKCGVKLTFMSWATLASKYEGIIAAWRSANGDLLD